MEGDFTTSALFKSNCRVLKTECQSTLPTMAHSLGSLHHVERDYPETDTLEKPIYGVIPEKKYRSTSSQSHCTVYMEIKNTFSL
jgi:hypothetical protein